MRFTQYLQESSANGDCYEIAGKFIMDDVIFNDDSRKILVHAIVKGQGPLAGVEFGHAWIEDGNTVIDKSNGRNITIPKQVYYAIGNIEDTPDKMRRYDAEEARKKMMEHEHYGPWDLKSEL